MSDVIRQPGLGLRKGKLSRRVRSDIQRIIIHHTGVGVLSRYLKQRDRYGWNDPIDAAVHVYTRIMSSSGHYVIGYAGEIVQHVPDDWSAWHAGYGNQRKRSRRAEWFATWKYSRKDKANKPLWLVRKDRRFDWWANKWWYEHGYQSPCEWFPSLDVNRHTIGIELLSTPLKTPFPAPQIQSLKMLVQDLCSEYGIPCDRDHVLTHSDVCPLARTTTTGKPYDPPPAKLEIKTIL
jgi:hypothetical protein